MVQILLSDFFCVATDGSLAGNFFVLKKRTQRIQEVFRGQMVGDGLGSTLLGRWVIYGNGQLLLLSIRLLGRQGFSVDQL